MRTRTLARWLKPISLSALALCLTPSLVLAQFPGGDRGSRGDRGGDRGSRGDRGSPGGFGGSRGGFGGGFNSSSMADMQFSRLQASYGGSGDSLDYSRIPQATRDQSNAMAQRFGSEPLPTSGVVTKDQFREITAKRMEAMMARRGGGGGGPPGMTMTFGSSGTPPGAPPAFGTPPAYGAPQPTPGGGNDPNQLSDEKLREYMSRYDKDRDGRISFEEGQGSDRLKSVFQTYDTNRDGFIDTTEYRAYVTDRMSGRSPGGDGNSPQSPYGGYQPGQPWGGQPGGPGYGGERPNEAPAEEPKPLVFRYGKLPKEIPSWFVELDTDQDGQVGLYEWKNDGRATTEFLSMDLNRDGLLTAEEYMEYKDPNFSMASYAAKGGGTTTGGDSGSRGSSYSRGGDRSSSSSKEEKREEKREERGSRSSGGNPFRR